MFLKEQLTGTYTNQKYQQKLETSIWIIWWTQVFKEKIKFLYYYLKIPNTKEDIQDIFFQK